MALQLNQNQKVTTIDFLELSNLSKNDRQLEALSYVFQDWTKYILYGGAAGGGKSYFLRWTALALGMYYSQRYRDNLKVGLDEYGRPRYRTIPIGLFSEDYPTLKDRQIIKIKEEFPSWLGRVKETNDEGLIFKPYPEYGNFIIMLRNLDDPSKYASTEFAAILVEEVTKNKVETFEDLRFRLRFPGIPDPKFVAATNPGSVGHGWVKGLWINPDPRSPDPEKERFKYIPSQVYDNMYLMKDSNYVKQLEALPEKKRKAFLEGSWDIFAGQVFTEWSDIFHVIDPFPVPKEWKRYISMDWGTNKPFSVGWYAIDFDGRTYLYRELYYNGDGFEEKFGMPLTPRRLAKVIMAINKKAADEDYLYCVADPAMWNDALHGKKSSLSKTSGESAAETMIKVGLKMIKADNDRMNGLDRYREVLSLAPDGKPWYQVFRTCYDTVRTIPSLVHNETGNVEDVETNGEDHCYDRDRYMFMSRPTKPIDSKPKPVNNLQRMYLRKQLEYERNQED